MDLDQKVSRAVKRGKIYNMEHFHQAWEDPNLRRLMGNELLFPPSPRVVEALQAVLKSANYYPEDASTNQKLRAQLADYVGIDGGPDWITLGNGSMEIIDMLPMTFIDEGDEILLPTPDYSPYTRRPLLFGGRVVDVLPDEAFNYTLQSFLQRITSKTKMILLSRPNAPVGNMIDREVIEALCDTDCMVVVDEAYAEFSGQSLCGLVAEHPNLIISRTFSKALGLGGIRLGFIVAQPEVIGAVNRIRMPLNVSLFGLVAASAALEDPEYIRTNVHKVIENREYFYDRLSEIPGLKAYPSYGNSILINCDATGHTAGDYIQQLLEAGYLVRNQSNARGLPGDGFFRVTIGTREDMEGVARVIRNFTLGEG